MSAYLRRQRQRYREALKQARGLPPVWPSMRATAYVPIPDHAFVPCDEAPVRGCEAVVVTQHHPHKGRDVQELALAAAVEARLRREEIMQMRKKTAKPKSKTVRPDSRWLLEREKWEYDIAVAGRVKPVPPYTPPLRREDYADTEHPGIVQCRQCNCFMHLDMLEEGWRHKCRP